MAVSPGPIRARHMWLKPSFEPMRGDDFVVGIELHAVLAVSTAWRLPCGGCRCRWRRSSGGSSGSASASASFSMMSGSGGSVGLPMPRSMTSIAGDPLLVLQLVDLAEQIRRQPLHPVGDRDGEGVVGKRDFGFAAHDESTVPGFWFQCQVDVWRADSIGWTAGGRVRFGHGRADRSGGKYGMAASRGLKPWGGFKSGSWEGAPRTWPSRS